MACQGLLVGSLHWCSGGWSWISSPWSAKKCLVLSFEVCGFGVTLGSLYIKAQVYVPALLENLCVCLAPELIGSWVELGVSVGIEAFG